MDVNHLKSIAEIYKHNVKELEKVYDTKTNNIDEIIDEICSALKECEKQIEDEHKKVYVTDEYENKVRSFTNTLVYSIIKNGIYKELKDNNYKDKQLQEMQDRLDRMTKEYNRGFPISEDEQKVIDEWKVKHKAEVHSATTSNYRSEFECVCGGNYLYQFIPTSIGVAGVITCSCGAKFEFQHIG